MSWRNRLRPASFRGVPFHVDENEKAGGRRLVPHEYPKRDQGYVENMGRRLRAFRVRGYIVGPNYDLLVLALETVLELDGPGLLILPTKGEFIVQAGNYSSFETREEGGYGGIDMEFLEAGSAPSAAASTNSGEAVTSAADAAKASTANSGMAGIVAPE